MLSIPPLDLRAVDDYDQIRDQRSPEPDLVSDGDLTSLDDIEVLDNPEPAVCEEDDCHVEIPDPESPETTDTGSDWTDSIDMGEIVDESDDGDKEIDSGKQMVTDEGESQKSSGKRKRNASCCTCRPRRPAKTRKRVLPEGYGYVPSRSYVDENDEYQVLFSDEVAYMSCDRCGINGDHWTPFCPNPINDGPEPDDPARKRFSWKYILRNLNRDECLEKQKIVD